MIELTKDSLVSELIFKCIMGFLIGMTAGKVITINQKLNRILTLLEKK